MNHEYAFQNKCHLKIYYYENDIIDSDEIFFGLFQFYVCRDLDSILDNRRHA